LYVILKQVVNLTLSLYAKTKKGGSQWQEQPDFSEPPLSLEGAADHWNHREDTDYYSQPGKLFRLMTAEQQNVLFKNTACAMGDAPKEIKIRHIGNFV